MNVKSLHTNENPVDAKKLFSGTTGLINSIQLQKDAIFKKHKTAIPATLLCLSGKVVFEYEHGKKIQLQSGDYEEVEVDNEHWFTALEDSQLILMR
jgi:quercetin dioxygenase-like cupin family protein